MTDRAKNLESRTLMETGTCVHTVTRIIDVTDETLRTWHAIMEETPFQYARPGWSTR